MRFWRAHAITVAMFALVLIGAALPSWGAAGCSLGCIPCSPPCSSNGCSAPVAVWQSGGAPCAGSGSFDLTATQYLATSGGAGTPVNPPPVRFWGYNGFIVDGNSGCPQGTTDPTAFWIGNGTLDYGQPAPSAGHWSMFQSNWNFPGVDGCFAAATPRTVAEISFPDRTAETTANHFSWFVIGSVPPDAGGSFEFNSITGANNCGTSVGNDMPAARVRGVTIPGRTAACTGTTTVTSYTTTNAADNTFFDVALTITDPNPAWYTEAGRNGAPTLIAGYQILYATGATDPTSSNYCNGWAPARSVTAPAMAAAIVPLATPTVTIALPKGTGTQYWLATRLVYTDPASPTAPFDPTVMTNGPRITSPVSDHCGPVAFGTVTAVRFASIAAVRTSQGVQVSWKTALEDDVISFAVFRSTSPDGQESLTEAADLRAEGAGYGYEALDRSADSSQTYYYFVQEFTSNGYGMTSQMVKVDGQAAPAPGAGSGRRSRARHGR